MGASYGRTEDQTNRFLEQGIWENGYEDKYLELGEIYSSWRTHRHKGFFHPQTQCAL